MDYILGGSLGVLIAFFFSLPAIVLEIKQKGEVQDAPLIVEVHTIFGRQLKKQEAFFVGLFIYLFFGCLFSVVYIFFVQHDWLFVTHTPYTFLSWIVYALFSWVVVGLVIYPALGMGIFARKEGRHVWIETIISHFILGVSLWILIQYYQPYFFK